MSIVVGLTGWGDHDRLYPEKTPTQDKLKEYSRYFSVVELDASYYAIQPAANYQKWAEETPETFRFVVKAHQDMTGQSRKKLTLQEAKSLFSAFRASIQPLIAAGKLEAVLFQFPPWFQVEQSSIQRLRTIRELLPELQIAIEFRNQSWYSQAYRTRTLQLLEQLDFIHTICDEPQAGSGSVPAVLQATSAALTLVRFHGRNVHGWNQNGRKDWRKVRFLYRYNQAELKEWVENIKQLEAQTERIVLLFNNNSGGDASDNAKDMMKLLGQPLPTPYPEQINLFGEEGE